MHFAAAFERVKFVPLDAMKHALSDKSSFGNSMLAIVLS